MKIVDYLVSKETINTPRISVSQTDNYSDSYLAVNSLQPKNVYSACTTFAATDPWYKILFTYDAIYSSEVVIGFKHNHRYPRNISLYGTSNLFDFEILVPSTSTKFCDDMTSPSFNCDRYV